MIPTSSHARDRAAVVVARPEGRSSLATLLHVKGRPRTGKARVQLASGAFLTVPLSWVQVAGGYDGDCNAQARPERLAALSARHTSPDAEANR